ncbi:MAG: RluA family pseudouridine synthase [Oscillospiraceae bacterium]|nr:RluA family pseudouridine synthase [Oscillospiraceae bacterium]
MEKTVLYALPQHAGQRIDLFISRALTELTRNAVQKLCADGCVQVDGKVCEKNLRLRGGEEVTFILPAPKALDLPAQACPLDIVFEDASMIILNKSQGMVVHPAPGHPDGTLVNALLHHCAGQLSGIGGVERPGIVHRLDKMTSGLMVVAKTEQAHRSLSAQIKDRTVKKIYHGVVYGCPKEDEGRVDASIGRHPTDRKKMSVTAKVSREAATGYRVLERCRGFGSLELLLETGRTHQIRVHMASIGHPIAGDILYGPKKGIPSLAGQCLHAKTLGLHHPVTGQYLEFDSELPEYFVKFLDKIRKG